MTIDRNTQTISGGYFNIPGDVSLDYLPEKVAGEPSPRPPIETAPDGEIAPVPAPSHVEPASPENPLSPESEGVADVPSAPSTTEDAPVTPTEQAKPAKSQKPRRRGVGIMVRNKLLSFEGLDVQSTLLETGWVPSRLRGFISAQSTKLGMRVEIARVGRKITWYRWLKRDPNTK